MDLQTRASATQSTLQVLEYEPSTCDDLGNYANSTSIVGGAVLIEWELPVTTFTRSWLYMTILI
jgi:hypothetical protein